MNLDVTDLRIIRCLVHDFDALKDALARSTTYGVLHSACPEWEAAVTFWRDSGGWPAWLLAERGHGHLTLVELNDEPRKDLP